MMRVALHPLSVSLHPFIVLRPLSLVLHPLESCFTSVEFLYIRSVFFLHPFNVLRPLSIIVLHPLHVYLTSVSHLLRVVLHPFV